MAATHQNGFSFSKANLTYAHNLATTKEIVVEADEFFKDRFGRRTDFRTKQAWVSERCSSAVKTDSYAERTPFNGANKRQKRTVRLNTAFR